MKSAVSGQPAKAVRGAGWGREGGPPKAAAAFGAEDSGVEAS